MVRFVDTSSEQLSSNYYRCPVKKWWSKFLGVVEKTKLVHNKPTSNKFIKSVTWIENNVAATSMAVIKSIGLKGFLGVIKSGSDKHYRNNVHNVIHDDYLNLDSFDLSSLEGMDKLSIYFNSENDFDDFLSAVKALRDPDILNKYEEEFIHQSELSECG